MAVQKGNSENHPLRLTCAHTRRLHTTAFARQQSFHRSMALYDHSSPDAPTADDPVADE
jgi:hypothetical protein